MLKRKPFPLLRCLCGILLLPLCFSSIGCTPAVDAPADTEPPASSAQPLTLVENGVVSHSVMRPEITDKSITSAAATLRAALEDLSGAAFTIHSDYIDRGQTVPTDTPEILVGLTNRQESIEAYATLAETEYCIRVMGNRLVVIGYDDVCTVKAVEALIALLPSLYQNNTLSLPADYHYKDTYVVKVWLNEFDKTSLSYYADDKLRYTEDDLLFFDSTDGIRYGEDFTKDGPGGTGVGFVTNRDNPHWSLVSTPTDSFDLSITDKFTQTVKLWVYVNDDELMACDHDAVYNTPQVGSQTLYITLSEEQGGVGHSWQHTFYGSGWHEIELSFTCHNVAYPNLEKINYDHLTSISIWCNAKKGLQVAFAGMRLCTYDNAGYQQPEAPYGGRWLSTCDYEALDGPILTEWYGAYFDLEEKRQGSSSLAITGHKENVDHRVCIGIDDVDVVYEEDTICFDMYISNLALLGTDWQIRLEHNAQAAHYTVNYDIMRQCVVDEKMRPTTLKEGWNHIQLPLNKTRVVIGEGYEDTFTNDLTLTQLVFFIAGTGTSEAQNYLIRYDNMYVAKTADLAAAK